MFRCKRLYDTDVRDILKYFCGLFVIVRTHSAIIFDIKGKPLLDRLKPAVLCHAAPRGAYLIRCNLSGKLCIP